VFALIESCPAQRPGAGWSGRIASLVIHSFVIGAALAFTRQVADEVTTRPPVDVVWQLPAPPDADPGTPLPAPGGIVSPVPVPAPLPPVDIPIDIPLPGTAVVFTPGSDPAPPGGLPGLDPRPGAIPGTAPRDVRSVDEPPALVSHPEIRYPDVLRQAGIEGRVMVEAVLDTLGRAEAGSTRIAGGTGTALFEQEALRVVLASRYRAARVDGHPVRVRIQVPVNFTLRR
jgi:protein TonB